jgi:hypothetical protein
MEYYCYTCKDTLNRNKWGYLDEDVKCHTCTKILKARSVAHFVGPDFDGETKNMKDYREIDFDNLKIGDYIRYVDEYEESGSFGEGTFHSISNVNATLYHPSYTNIVLKQGILKWTITHSDGMKFFIKIFGGSDEKQTVNSEMCPKEFVHPDYIEVNASEIKIGQHIRYHIPSDNLLSGEVRVTSISCSYITVAHKSSGNGFAGWAVKMDGTRFYAKKSDATESGNSFEKKIQELEAKLETLQKEKAESDVKFDLLQKEKDASDALVKTTQDALDKANKLSQMKNKGLPEGILKIVDEYKLFDLLSLFRATFESDVDVERLNDFVKTIVSIKYETTVPVEHTVKLKSTTKSLIIWTANLYHEMHLAEIYASMKAYFAKNDVALFSIDSTNPIVVTKID